MFENGQFIDVEQFHVQEFKAGAGNIMYKDLNGNLKIYEKGKLETVSNFAPDFYDVRDSVMVWGENNYLFLYYNQKKTEIARFIPEEYSIKNQTIVFTNLMGGVSCYNQRGYKEITTQQDAQYTIHGNGVLVELFNKSFIYYIDGKVYNL